MVWYKAGEFFCCAAGTGVALIPVPLTARSPLLEIGSP
jgi:hypothetical protein